MSLPSAIEDVRSEATSKDDDDHSKHDAKDLASGEFLIARDAAVRLTRECGVLGVASLVDSAVLRVLAPGAVVVISVSASVAVSVLASEVTRAASLIEALASLGSVVSSVEATSTGGIRAPSASIGGSTSWASSLLAARDFASHSIVEEARSVSGLSRVSFDALIIAPTTVGLGETTITVLFFRASRFARATLSIRAHGVRCRSVDASL